ncbi:MAG: hypothetical protein ACRC62_34530 [Microcoleus sp.]
MGVCDFFVLSLIKSLTASRSALLFIDIFTGCFVPQLLNIDVGRGGGRVMSLNELPGSELILPGLDDLHHGKMNTIGSLLVAIAATRLVEAGLDVSRDCLATEPELTLYSLLEDEQDDAYLYYNALLNRLNSFCNALELRSMNMGRSITVIRA